MTAELGRPAELWKISHWFGERDRVRGGFVSDVLLDRMVARGMSSAVVLRAAGGFGPARVLRSDDLLTLSEDPSVVVTAIDERPRIDDWLAEVRSLQDRGMITVERCRPVSVAVADPTDEWEWKLSVFLGRGPAGYVDVVRSLHEHGIVGASALLGVDGVVAGVRRRASMWSRNRQVPSLVLAVGDQRRIAAARNDLAEIVPGVELTVERVRVCRHDGAEIRPPEASEAARWQRLTAYTSEAQLRDGVPAHRGIVQNLRAAGLTGATVLRGLWGFHGDHEPHGDRLWQLGRRVPVITTTVDTPERITRAYDVVSDLTSERGLVTVENVPEVLFPGAAEG